MSAALRAYFRAEVRHLERVPEGPVLLVSNHDGGLEPIDGLLLVAAWHRHFEHSRPLRVLVHELLFRMATPLSELLARTGCVSATRENFGRAAERGEAILVYPGAAREAFRRFGDRRSVDLGGRTGFIARALDHRLPITPVASVGGQEMMFILARGQRLARWLGLPRRFRSDAWPLCLGLPWLLWWAPMIPYLPLPSKLTLEVLDPVVLREELPTLLGWPLTAADYADPITIRAGYELVTAVLQAGVARLYAERRFPVLG